MLVKMWGGISQLDLPYEVRHMQRFRDKHQRPLTDREKEIIERVKGEDRPLNKNGYRVPNIKVTFSTYYSFVNRDNDCINEIQVMEEYNLTLRERRVIMDEVRGKTGNDRTLRPPLEPSKVDHRKTSPKSSYLELLRCGGKLKTGSAMNK